MLENVSDVSVDHTAFIFRVENQGQGGQFLSHQNGYCHFKDSASWSHHKGEIIGRRYVMVVIVVVMGDGSWIDETWAALNSITSPPRKTSDEDVGPFCWNAASLAWAPWSKGKYLQITNQPIVSVSSRDGIECASCLLLTPVSLTFVTSLHWNVSLLLSRLFLLLISPLYQWCSVPI